MDEGAEAAPGAGERTEGEAARRVGVITGSGVHALPGFDGDPRPVSTPYGEVLVTEGELRGVEILHLSRHGQGHVRLSNHVTHHANISALRELGAVAVVGCTACGVCDPEIELGTLIVFDDLHFPSNRLPDGSLATFHAEAGAAERGHWILSAGPYAESVRQALLAAARHAGRRARDGGTYGHVDGPRFNTPSEIAALAAAGVTAVSQTAGPETVLCGELELPYALLGYATDHANSVAPEPTSMDELWRLMGESATAFGEVLAEALQRIASDPGPAPGTVFRFEQG